MSRHPRSLTFAETGAALRVEVDRIKAEVGRIVAGWMVRVWPRR